MNTLDENEQQEMYKENIIDHYQHPRNKKVLVTATHQAQVMNPLCSDEITVYLEVNEDKIIDVSFEGRGCAISQASISLLTQKLKGMQIDEAAALIPCDVHALLSIPLSYSRRKCAFLSLEALQQALKSPLEECL